MSLRSNLENIISLSTQVNDKLQYSLLLSTEEEIAANITRPILLKQMNRLAYLYDMMAEIISHLQEQAEDDEDDEN
jgi:hypothetical protein